jgi:PKD repeat protein
LSCLWDFGDGTSSTDCDPCHVFTNCGQYAVSVVVNDGLVSTNATMLVTVACPMTITKMQVKLNFSKANSDSASLSAIPDLDANYNVAGKLVTLDIGGAQVQFTLDAKGRGVSGLGSCKLAFNKKAGYWTLTVKLANGEWRTQWAAYGLVNSNVAKPGASVIMPVVAVIGDEVVGDKRPMLYTATLNKSGSAK